MQFKFHRVWRHSLHQSVQEREPRTTARYQHPSTVVWNVHQKAMEHGQTNTVLELIHHWPVVVEFSLTLNSMGLWLRFLSLSYNYHTWVRPNLASQHPHTSSPRTGPAHLVAWCSATTFSPFTRPQPATAATEMERQGNNATIETCTLTTQRNGRWLPSLTRTLHVSEIVCFIPWWRTLLCCTMLVGT